MDGFKPSQRKVLWACFKKKMKNDCKVAQLAGYISEHAAYHHGETSLQDTIVGMAQDFVGSNNVNLLLPVGQFGTRLQGGKDASAARYIYTRLAPVTRAIFKELDDPILEYQDEEGQAIEPVWFAPIIPMILVNGCDGIGTGWSSSVPCFNPRDIISNIRRHLHNQKLEEMLPYYQGYTGTIKPPDSDGKCLVVGCVEMHGNNKATISELPIKKWTQDYREFLEECVPKGQKRGDKDKMLDDYTEHHTDRTVHFNLHLAQEFKDTTQLEKALKLRTTVSLNNMMLFNQDGKITKYDSPMEILTDFCRVRIVLYEKRKAYILARLQKEAEVLSEKARFIKLVLKGEIKVKKRKIFDLIADLKKHAFKALREIKGPELQGEAEAEDEQDKEESEEESDEENASEELKRKKATKQGVKDYEYLVGMAIVTLTMEKIQELTNQKDLKIQERDALKKKTPKQIWLDDLDVLDEALNERLKLRQKEEREERARIEKSRAKAGFKDARRVEAEEKEKQREKKRASSTSSLGRLKKAKVD
jgi:DNA topoisomerase-2